MRYLHPEQAIDFIRSSNDKIFSVVFRKKTAPDEIRHMTCRLHVTRGVKGVRPNRALEDKRNDVITVFDMQKHEFRRINLPQILSIRAKGVEYSAA